ncbi:hypothetical protein HGA88_03215 [Candidatus Roizmanbacteria bacterium]|nr:hypothetical protein [Candidatus Roizmanbacteria bacterium]
MRKSTQQLRDKSGEELIKEIVRLKSEISHLVAAQKVNPEKDCNVLFKKRKELAVVLTIKRSQELETK